MNDKIQQNIADIEEKKEEVEMKPYLTPKQLNKIYKESMENAPQIILDCSFQDLLLQKELNSLCSQIGYCHSTNKKHQLHCKMTITSYRDKVKEKLIRLNAEQWGILLLEKHYLDYYSKEQLVYLTGDAEEDLEELDKKYYFNKVNSNFQ